MKPEEDPDVQLMLAVQRDDARAFETLFQKYTGRLVAFASSFVHSRARAEEIAQEAFVKVFRTRKRYRPRARFATWLYRIAGNLCISEVRRAEHRFTARRGGTDEDSDRDPGTLPDPAGRDSETEAHLRESLRRAREVLDRLPGQQRAAILLARVEGFSYEEVAESLGCSVSSVKSLVHRATVALRSQLGGDGDS